MGCTTFYVYKNMIEWAVNVNRFNLFKYLRLVILPPFFFFTYTLLILNRIK